MSIKDMIAKLKPAKPKPKSLTLVRVERLSDGSLVDPKPKDIHNLETWLDEEPKDKP